LLRLDPVEDSQQQRTRQAVIVSRDSINRVSPVIVVCPLTDAQHVAKLYPSDVLVEHPEGGLTKDAVVLTGQIRAVAKVRLLRRLGKVRSETMHRIEQAVKITLKLS
jgi:mRNA interferase MazF